MDVNQFLASLNSGLQRVPAKEKLSYIKARISSISDENERRLAETCFLLGQNVSTPKIVVALVHGIRTCATWQEVIRNRLESSSSAITYPIGYGYLDVIRFLCPFFTRKSPVEKVLQELRGIQIEHRNDKLCVIAHSFGTYIISRILLKHPDIKIYRLLLCGSVISTKLRWDNVAKFPGDGVINDCGTKDIWPVFANFASWGYGATGTFGFKTFKVRDRYHNMGHSDFFNLEFINKFWLPFILEGKRIESDWENNRPVPSSWLSLLNMFPFKTIIALLIIFYGIKLCPAI